MYIVRILAVCYQERIIEPRSYIMCSAHVRGLAISYQKHIIEPRSYMYMLIVFCGVLSVLCSCVPFLCVSEVEVVIPFCSFLYISLWLVCYAQ